MEWEKRLETLRRKALPVIDAALAKAEATAREHGPGLLAQAQKTARAAYDSISAASRQKPPRP